MFETDQFLLRSSRVGRENVQELLGVQERARALCRQFKSRFVNPFLGDEITGDALNYFQFAKGIRMDYSADMPVEKLRFLIDGNVQLIQMPSDFFMRFLQSPLIAEYVPPPSFAYLQSGYGGTFQGVLIQTDAVSLTVRKLHEVSLFIQAKSLN